MGAYLMCRLIVRPERREGVGGMRQFLVYMLFIFGATWAGFGAAYEFNNNHPWWGWAAVCTSLFLVVSAYFIAHAKDESQ